MSVRKVIGKAQRVVWHAKRAKERRRNRALREHAARNPYEYDRERYVHYYLNVRTPSSPTFSVNHLDHEDVPAPIGPLPPAPNLIFTFWTGSTPMSDARRQGFEALQAINPDSEIILVTPENLPQYLVAGHPLPRGYSGLSEMHRSDYLRSYFMLFHGGVYCDVKAMTAPWLPVIERLNADDQLWAIGPEELSPQNTSPVPGPLGVDQRARYFEIPSQSAFVFKPGSPLAKEWFDEVQRRMRYFEDLLERHPATSPHDSSAEYPVPWSDLNDHILSPLFLKHHRNVAVASELALEIKRPYR